MWQKKVLSIDGGGIGGIIPAIVLAHIETETGKPICELFDLIAGTSTGGILALALTVPGLKGSPKYSAEEIIDLYVKRGTEIFPRPTLRRQRFLRNLFGPKYSQRGLESVLQDYFEDARMDEALTDVMIPGYNIDTSTSWFFKSRGAKKVPARNYLMWEVARATSAAPTYFSPGRVHPPESQTEDFHPIIDGGVFANNPAMCAYVETLTQHAEKDKVLVVSLGTGEAPPHLILYSKARRWGLLQWAPPMLGVVFDGVSDTVDYQLDRLLREYENYYRFQPDLGRGYAMDDTRKETLRLLRSSGEKILTKYRQDLDLLCNRLVG